MNKTIRCNNTMKEYDENELILLKDKETGEYYKGCPCCQTDNYLMDIEQE